MNRFETSLGCNQGWIQFDLRSLFIPVNITINTFLISIIDISQSMNRYYLHLLLYNFFHFFKKFKKCLLMFFSKKKGLFPLSISTAFGPFPSATPSESCSINLVKSFNQLLVPFFAPLLLHRTFKLEAFHPY